MLQGSRTQEVILSKTIKRVNKTIFAVEKELHEPFSPFSMVKPLKIQLKTYMVKMQHTSGSASLTLGGAEILQKSHNLFFQYFSTGTTY